jgi:hypothetical protein
MSREARLGRRNDANGRAFTSCCYIPCSRRRGPGPSEAKAANLRAKPFNIATLDKIRSVGAIANSAHSPPSTLRQPSSCDRVESDTASRSPNGLAQRGRRSSAAVPAKVKGAPREPGYCNPRPNWRVASPQAPFGGRANRSGPLPTVCGRAGCS